MRHVTWLLVALVAALTILPACSSTPPPRHDYDKTRSHADDAQRDLESEEGKHQ
jgi:hypothetical protein